MCSARGRPFRHRKKADCRSCRDKRCGSECLARLHTLGRCAPAGRKLRRCRYTGIRLLLPLVYTCVLRAVIWGLSDGVRGTGLSGTGLSGPSRRVWGVVRIPRLYFGARLPVYSGVPGNGRGVRSTPGRRNPHRRSRSGYIVSGQTNRPPPGCSAPARNTPLSSTGGAGSRTPCANLTRTGPAETKLQPS